MLLYPYIYMYNYSDTTLTADNIGTMFTELSPYSPLHTESFTTRTPTPTVDAMDAAITAQTNFSCRLCLTLKVIFLLL